jgi:hypothetical protein
MAWGIDHGVVLQALSKILDRVTNDDEIRVSQEDVEYVFK